MTLPEVEHDLARIVALGREVAAVPLYERERILSVDVPKPKMWSGRSLDESYRRWLDLVNLTREIRAYKRDPYRPDLLRADCDALAREIGV